MVAVLNKEKKPLMPCSEKRARTLMQKGEAKPYWYKGVFSIILTKDAGCEKQDIVIAFDTGSKMSALTVKSNKATMLNVQYSAPTHVKSKVQDRTEKRRARRQRNTPYRKCRFNRAVKDRIPPSTKSRWHQHLNFIRLFSKLYPINIVCFEDIKAETIKGKKLRYNKTFSPLQVGKNWCYEQVKKDYQLFLYHGFDTHSIRLKLGLKKGKDKLKAAFESHCVDSWALANDVIGGHIKPDNTRLLYLKPLVFPRRELHKDDNIYGGRRPYGGTVPLGIKKGTLIKHKRYGLCLTGGTTNNRLSLHDFETNKRITQNAKVEDLQILTNLKYVRRLVA
jgi:hypothetical protein